MTYQYRNSATNTVCDPLDSSDRKDVTQLAGVNADLISSESYCHDPEGRVSSKTLTLISRSDYPFVTDHIYDNLDRVTDVLYPKQWGNGQQPRKQVHHDYDIASRLSDLTYDGQSFASNIVYNAASQTTSLKVGVAEANQITENYSYNAQTGLLDNQTVARGATTLLDLSYDYLRPGTTSGRTGQLTKILNNLNHNKDRGYSYDALGRLVQATGGVGGALWTQTYSYDRYGNRTSVVAIGYSAANKSAIRNSQSEIARVSEPRAIATGSNTQASAPPGDLLASNTLDPRGIVPTVKDGSEPLSDSPPTLYTPAPQPGPPAFTDDPLNDPPELNSWPTLSLKVWDCY